MTIYKYYAVIDKAEDEEQGFTVAFPDLSGCITEGDNLPDAVTCAEEALGGYLLTCENFNDDIPVPSKAKDIFLADGASLVLIEVNTDDFRES